MKFFQHCLLFITLSAGLNACQKSDTKSPQQQAQAPGIDMLSAATYKLMTPAYYCNSADGKSIQVRFYESPRIFDLSKSAPGFLQSKMLIDKARDNKTVLRVYINDERDSYVHVQKTEAANQDELKKSIQTQPAPEESVAERTSIPNKKALDSIFNFCAAQGCAANTYVIDYCIPFQYAVDGCYARAHKMRQIMVLGYKYDCEKIFSYEGSNGSLAVDAGDCCVYWWYHVAPLVTVKMPEGNRKYVIDPSLFSEAVPAKVWISVQQNRNCSSTADFGHYEIKPGYEYAPGGARDDYYVETNKTLRLYANLETCN